MTINLMFLVAASFCARASP